MRKRAGGTNFLKNEAINSMTSYNYLCVLKTMSFLTVIMMALLSCSTIKKMSDTDERYEFYLLVGQSNMAGPGFIEQEDTTVHPRVFVLDVNDKFILAKEPLHYDKKNRGSGPGLSFGKAMANANRGKRIGLIPAAVGGTKISYWTPDNDRGLYKEAVRKAKFAMSYGKLKGIVWQQGESDSNGNDAPLYKQRLKQLISTFRKDLGNENLPVVVGGLGDFLRSKYFHQINKALQEVSTEMKNVRFSEASKLGHIGDSLHFNAKAQRENGRKMAEAMLELQRKHK